MPLLTSPTPAFPRLRPALIAAVSALALLAAPLAAAEPGDVPEVEPAVTVVQPPTIGGSAEVGATLAVATDPVWSPEDAATTYQWLRNDEPIPDPDAADRDYTLTAADLGAALAVQATGTKEGLGNGTTVSEPTAPVAPGTLVLVSEPVVTGLPRVGSTLTAEAPTWSQNDVSTSFQWLRANQPIAGATTTKLELTSADVGKAIAVRATGTKPGYAAVAATSAATGQVNKIPALLTVTGRSPKVGEVSLTIKVTATGEPALGGTAWVKRGSTLLRNELPITNGQATFTATKMPSGTHTYTVFYRGTTRVASAKKSTRVTTKAKVTPTIALKGSATPGKVNLAITVTATGQPPLGGTAYVKEGTKTLKSGIKVIRGRASWSASGVKSGSHTYRVGYNGTTQVSTGSKTITVKVPAPVKLVKYANCAALNKVHPHGVGRTGAKDKVSGSSKPVTTFLRHTKLYELNTGRDRDKDGVACEKA